MCRLRLTQSQLTHISDTSLGSLKLVGCLPGSPAGIACGIMQRPGLVRLLTCSQVWVISRSGIACSMAATHHRTRNCIPWSHRGCLTDISTPLCTLPRLHSTLTGRALQHQRSARSAAWTSRSSAQSSALPPFTMPAPAGWQLSQQAQDTVP